MATLVHDITNYRIPLLIAGVAVAAVLIGVLVRRLPPGTPWWYYAGAFGGLAVSLDTSWRFFGDRLHIVGAERVVMFCVTELALVACAAGMRANVRRVDLVTGRRGAAGAPRLVAWALCGLAGYAAILLSGPVEGAARVALGPVLGLVMLHLALGIEIRHAGARAGAWPRVVGELRERALSRLVLADDERDAVTRTRERATTRAARLAMTPRSPRRAARLARALRVAGVAHDPLMRDRLLAELAVLRHADELATLPQPSPWHQAEPEPVFDPPASDDTIAAGELDGVILAANADDTDYPWHAVTSKNAAIDRADDLLPGRTPRQLVAALNAVDVTVAESSVRRRRAERDKNRMPRPRSAIR